VQIFFVCMTGVKGVFDPCRVRALGFASGPNLTPRAKNAYFMPLIHKFVTQSRTGLQIYEGHDDQLNRPGPMA
jgi:hypothetical protein